MNRKRSAWSLRPLDPVDLAQLRRESQTRAAWTIAAVLALSLLFLWLVQRYENAEGLSNGIQNQGRYRLPSD